MTRVKICGLTNLEDALFAVEAGADALGFVFYPPSKRSITPAAAAEIVRRLPPFVQTVGVFVDETAEQIAAVRRTVGLAAVQLSGDEAAELADRLDRPVLKCFRRPPADLPRWNVAAVIADGAQPGSYGGTGTSADEDLVEALKGHGAPLILAGGLTPLTVAERIRRWRPFGVDVASGVEASPGRKDKDKLTAFIAAAKSA